MFWSRSMTIFDGRTLIYIEQITLMVTTRMTKSIKVQKSKDKHVNHVAMAFF